MLELEPECFRLPEYLKHRDARACGGRRRMAGSQDRYACGVWCSGLFPAFEADAMIADDRAGSR